MPPSLESNFEGEVYLRWLAVRKAKSYFITVTDESGAEIRTYRTPYVAIYLKGLPRPTNKDREKYLIKLATVNANDLVGPFSSPRVLFVKKPIDLTAPKIKDIRVED